MLEETMVMNSYCKVPFQCMQVHLVCGTTRYKFLGADASGQPLGGGNAGSGPAYNLLTPFYHRHNFNPGSEAVTRLDCKS